MEKMTLPEWMKSQGPQECPAPSGGRPRGFLEKSLKNFASALKEALASETTAARDGAMQGLEPRAKLAGFFMLILAAAFPESWYFLLAVLALTFGLSIITKAGALPLLKRALPATVFTAVLSVPAIFGLVTPGKELVGSGAMAITVEGVKTALFFVLRVSSMASLASLAMMTTKQADFFRGLGRLAPGFFVTALFFTFKYVLILIKAAEDSALARKSRTINKASIREAQRWFASRAALLLKRSLNTAEEVSMAMASRGFDGRVSQSPAGTLRGREYLWLGVASFVLFLSFGF